MADNYLEKRMEDYAKGRLAGRSSSFGRRAGAVGIKYPPQGILVVNAIGDKARVIVKAFVDVGCRVAFTASDTKFGTALAQHCGGRFYPLPLASVADDMQKRGEKVDTVIEFGDYAESFDRFGSVRTIRIVEKPATDPTSLVISGGTSESVAIMALALAHPAMVLPPQTIMMLEGDNV